MSGLPSSRRWPLALLVVGLPVASAATLGVTDGTVTVGNGTPSPCDSGSPTVVQTIGAGLSAGKVVSLDVSGILAGCAGGTVQVSLFNGTDAVQSAAAAIPAGGGTVSVALATAVPLTASHVVAVALQGP